MSEDDQRSEDDRRVRDPQVINQNFYCDCVHITEMHGNEAFIEDKTGDCMIVVYDPATRQVMAK